MSPVALYFASGESFYAGVAILMFAIVVSPFLKRRWMLQLRSLVAWLALALIVMACPPFAWVIDALFLTLFGAWLILSKKRSTGKTLAGVRGGVGAGLFMLLLVLSLLEFARRTMPLITGVPSDHLVVIDATLSKLAAPGRTVVMFELPLLPHKIAYGQIQRRLATKYGVFLIPKRYFADAISGADATSDGLHLSNLGARRMASLVENALSHVLGVARPTSGGAVRLPNASVIL